ncbi:FAD dependent oxidoreductase [Corchorus capsularis]|uniref:FAD dependent oxidoreductase n=1 Tax=Corchorus capsularis TaxID=210143 RepID=A0A1R3GUM3_COCAP|nr:FAD dependent oxidoreductase [Corchorus capsularis]
MLLFDSLSPLTHSVKISSPVLLSSPSHRPLRYAVLGAGFAGLSVAWHLLKQSPKDMNLHIDLYDEVGIGGGASGVSGGLLHPYSPKVKLLWRGAECWKEGLNLLSIAEQAISSEELDSETGEFSEGFGGFIVRRRGILRPATNMKTLNILNDNAQNYLPSCKIETIDKDAALKLVPHLHVPFNLAFYMPEAVNVNSLRYLKALFLACQNLVKEISVSGDGKKRLHLQKKSVSELRELEGEYDAVIICLGAKADLLPELAGRLPLRTCRGVILELQLPDKIGEDYPNHGPSILSDAWLAIQGNRHLYMGSTWEWKSRNSSPNVSTDEASNALQELLPKASAVYPGLRSWNFAGARAGLRAMPPLTPHGSLPLLGCVNNFLGENLKCKYWLLGGLGSRGLLYHGWLGKLTAEAVLSCNEQIIPSELTSWKNK